MESRPVQPRGNPSPARILVVDDDDILRETLAGFLREEGLVVDVAASVGHAVRAARQAPPKVVLLDLGMPEIDGWEAIRLLRREARKEPPHIIVMSGFTDPSSRRRAFELGCDQYVVKEAGPEALVSAVRTYLSRISA